MKQLTYTPREELAEPGSESAIAGWKNQHFFQFGGNVVVNVQRTRERRQRHAITWLYFYMLREQLTAKQLIDRLGGGLQALAIRRAFVDPNEDASVVVDRAEKLRAALDATLREPADTNLHKRARKALRFAVDTHSIAELIAKTREGKTMTADWFHLKEMHRAVYYACRSDVSDRDFFWGLARAHGISVGNGKTVSQIKDQIRGMYGNGGLELLIIDEGHYLWPVNITEKPKRIEFLRALYDEKRETMGIAEFTTPQGLISMNLSLERCERWAPGQWEGRLVRFRSDDTTTEADLARVARWHAPEADAATINQLVIYAQASPGLLGSMIGVLKLARFNAKDAGHKLRLQDVRDAIIEATSSPKLVKAMKEKGLVS